MKSFEQRIGSSVAAVLAAGTLFGGCAGGAVTSPGNRGAVVPAELYGEGPNILFLLADDLNYDSVGAAGNSVVRTPHIDSIAEKGTRFTQAHIRGSICGAVCMPSRAMIMTGKDLYDVHKEGAYIPAEDTTLPEHLLEAGYRTFGTGKWHNGREAYARSFSDGGNIFFGGMADHYATPVHDFDPRGRYRGAADRPDRHSSELFADAAVDFLQEHTDERPFMMFVSFTAPHDPRTAPQRWHDAYPLESIPVGPDFLPSPPFDTGELDIRDENLAPFPRTHEIYREHHSGYYAMISHMDEQIGRILGALAETGKADNTIIVITSDNGLSVGRHGLMGKQHLYEESIRVPLILAGPGIPDGEVRDASCFLQDIFPTLCDLTGLEKPQSLTFGRSLVPSLAEAKLRGREEMVFGYKNLMRGIKRDSWKLVLYNVNGVQSRQLFSLKDDPDEMKNLAGVEAHHQTESEMEQLLYQKMRSNGDFCDPDSRYWGHKWRLSWDEALKLYP